MGQYVVTVLTQQERRRPVAVRNIVSRNPNKLTVRGVPVCWTQHLSVCVPVSPGQPGFSPSSLSRGKHTMQVSESMASCREGTMRMHTGC